MLKNNDKGLKPRVAIYIRVSTHHQVDKESLPFQRQELENYCKFVMNTDDYFIFEDAGYSAKNTDRPQFQNMMARIRKKEFTHLLVWKIDRMSRNLRDFTEMWDELKEYEVTFVSKMEQFDTSSAMGEAMLRIILIFAELERKLTAERVYGLMLDRAAKGLWNGAPVALGYDWDYENKEVQVNDEEAELIQLIFDLYEEIGSTVQVARWLTENGKKTKRGGEWGGKGVWDILRNPAYIGIYRWNYQEGGRGKKKPEAEVITVPNALPAIIAEEQFNRVQAKLDANSRGRMSRSKHYIPLSQIMKCSKCGKAYIGKRSGKARKDGYNWIYYQCGSYSRNRSCDNASFSSLRIEPWLLNYIRSYVAVQKNGGDILAEFNCPEIEHIEIAGSSDIETAIAEVAEVQVNNTIETRKLKTAQDNKKKIERALTRLDDAYFFGDGETITKNEYIQKRASFRSNLKTIDRELATYKTKPIPAINIEELSRFLVLNSMYEAKEIEKVYPSLDPNILHDFFHSTIKEIKIDNGRVDQITLFAHNGNSVHKFYYKDN